MFDEQIVHKFFELFNNRDEMWRKTFGGVGDDHGYSVRQTSDGGYILLGAAEIVGAGSEDR